MLFRHFSSYIFLFLFFSGCTCNETIVYESEVQSQRDIFHKDTLVKYNAELFKREQEFIKQYVKVHKLDAISLGDGAFICYKKVGRGKKASEGKIITIDFSQELLDKTVTSSTERAGLMEFRIGERKTVVGLDKAAAILREGDEVVLILPSYLAFGVRGNMGNIPPQSPVVYRLAVKKVRFPEASRQLN